MSRRNGEPRRIHLPFLSNEEIGLGDVIKRATSAVGIKPCGGCQRRAERLNQMVRFRGRGSQGGGFRYPDE